MVDEIKNSIDVMQDCFFEKLSYPLLNCFSSKKEAIITSDEYANHLKKIINELNIVEYFLLNTQGSYLLIKEDGTRHYFMILLDKQLDEYIEIAQDMKGDSHIINKMIERTHAPFFISETDYKLPVSDWNFLLQPIQQANGYHYCVTASEDRI